MDFIPVDKDILRDASRVNDMSNHFFINGVSRGMANSRDNWFLLQLSNDTGIDDTNQRSSMSGMFYIPT